MRDKDYGVVEVSQALLRRELIALNVEIKGAAG